MSAIANAGMIKLFFIFSSGCSDSAWSLSSVAIRINIRIRPWTFSKTGADLQAGEKELPSAMDAQLVPGGCFEDGSLEGFAGKEKCWPSSALMIILQIEASLRPVRPFNRPFRHFCGLISDEGSVLCRAPQNSPVKPLVSEDE
jgi:hypothetical protein